MDGTLVGPGRQFLSRVKFWASRPLGAKTYWYLMGKLKPVPAVTSQFSNLRECLASGEEVVSLLDRLGVVHPEAVTLQIGSGLGRVEYHLAPLVKRCYGTDISSSMVSQARRLVPHENAEFVCTDGKDLSSWEDDSLDVVYSFLVFQHLPRPQFARYVHEAHAKLVSGGCLVFQLPLDETSDRREPPASHPYALRRYTRSEVRELLDRAAFSDVILFDLEGNPDTGAPVTDVVFKATA